MSGNSKYIVHPEPIAPLSENEKKNIRVSFDDLLGPAIGLAFGMWIAAAIVIASLSEDVLQYLNDHVWLVFLVPTLVGIALLSRMGRVKYLNKKSATEGKKRENNICLANKLTTGVAMAMADATDSQSRLQPMLDNAMTCLDNAKREYSENAYGPFWDQIEQAASYLGVFDQSVRKLSANAEFFYNSLNGRSHNFPDFCVHNEAIPDSEDTVKEFRDVVRLGQTNHEFAIIFEHRKTQKILIEGFSTLGGAIGNLGFAIERSISNMRDVLSSEIANVVHEQIQTRDALVIRADEQKYQLEDIKNRL